MKYLLPIVALLFACDLASAQSTTVYTANEDGSVTATQTTIAKIPAPIIPTMSQQLSTTITNEQAALTSLTAAASQAATNASSSSSSGSR